MRIQNVVFFASAFSAEEYFIKEIQGQRKRDLLWKMVSWENARIMNDFNIIYLKSQRQWFDMLYIFKLWVRNFSEKKTYRPISINPDEREISTPGPIYAQYMPNICVPIYASNSQILWLPVCVGENWGPFCGKNLTYKSSAIQQTNRVVQSSNLKIRNKSSEKGPF